MGEPKDIVLPVGGIVIRVTGNGDGKITSELKDYEEEDAEDYNSAIDGIESLILAHALSGVDVESAPYVDGIKTAIDAIGNNL